MKLKRILTTTFLASILTLGVGLFVANNNKAEVKPVEAAGTATLYVEHFTKDGYGGTWSNFKYYLFGSGGNNGWPGVAFTDNMKTKTPNENGTYQYVLTVDTNKYQKLVLTGNSDSSWGGAFAKTEDYVIEDGKGLYCGAHKGWQTDANVFAVSTYDYSKKTVYLYDIAGNVFNTTHNCHAWKQNKGGTTWPGVSMDKVASTNNIYSLEINGALDSIIFNQGDGAGQTADITDVSDGNVYIVYPNFGYNISTLDAASFIDKYMKFETRWYDVEGTGECKSLGWYSSAKSAFNGKTTAVKTKILENEPTQYRLANWAKANGDTLDVSAKTLSSSRITPLFSTTGSNSSMMAIVIVSVLSITALGGYFFFRKSKHEND